MTFAEFTFSARFLLICPTRPSWTMSHDGCRSRSRARGTTTGAPTQARAGTAPRNPPHSTRPPKPLPPRTIIRIPPNRPSSRAEATGSSLIQPRVGLSKAPLLRPPTCLTQSPSFPNRFLFPSLLFFYLLTFPSSVVFLFSLHAVLSFVIPTLFFPLSHPLLLLHAFFAFSCPVFLVAMMSPSSEAFFLCFLHYRGQYGCGRLWMPPYFIKIKSNLIRLLWEFIDSMRHLILWLNLLFH